MKIQHVFKLATLAALLSLSIGSANSQISDSTSLPSNTAAPLSTFRPPPPVTNTYITNPPVTNNYITYPQTRVNTYIASGSGAGRPNAGAYASCGANKMIAGGGSCWDGFGMTPVIGSQPNGNGWSHSCSSYNGNTAYATSYAVCSY
jgi:hypothetical protein